MVSQISRHFSVVSKFIRCHFYLRVSKKIVLKRKMSEYFGKRQAGETPASSCKRIKVSAACCPSPKFEGAERHGNMGIR